MIPRLLDAVEWYTSRAVCRVLGHRWATFPFPPGVMQVCTRTACHGCSDATRFSDPDARP